jgi:MFS family permease
MTGIAVVMYYATDIFRAAGFSTDSAIGQTVLLGLTNLVFTIIAMVLIDRVGRKILLLVGTLGMTLFLSLFALAFIQNSFGGWLLLLLLIGYVAFFASSVGAVIWVILPEIFPNNIRSRGVAIGSFSNWITNSLLNFLFPIVAGAFTGGAGIGLSFSFFAIMTFTAFFVFKKFLFETKKKTLEKIESEIT